MFSHLEDRFSRRGITRFVEQKYSYVQKNYRFVFTSNVGLQLFSLSNLIVGARVCFVLALQFYAMYCFYLNCLSLVAGNVGNFKHDLLHGFVLSKLLTLLTYLYLIFYYDFLKANYILNKHFIFYISNFFHNLLTVLALFMIPYMLEQVSPVIV